jgi:N-acetylmuramoyl-L-alanine amidase
MRLYRPLLILLSLLFGSACWAQAEIDGVRMWPAPDNTRLVFDTSAPVEHSLFTLKNPDRIVIDIKGTSLKTDLDKLDFSNSLLKNIRSARHGKRDLRVVLDLKEQASPKSFVLRPNEEYGNRLVIDLALEDVKKPREKKSLRSIAAEKNVARNVVIAIDAGHGGEDPGAIGHRRTREKDVTLAIARRLRDLIAKEPGMKPVMIRDGDYFIPLKRRVRLAYEHNADLFISIHADSFPDTRARGASVYTLSPNGASSEQASLLADKENASDIIGGVELDEHDDLLNSVLLDLSLTGSMVESMDVAKRMLDNLKGISKLHRRKVEQAGFRVLKSANRPAVLVETAFISNPREERMLKDSSHQYKLAKALLTGVRSYFRENPPPGTILAQAKRKHIIARGDTLSGIARTYRVSLDSLRDYNGLNNNELHIGQVLRIPSGS